MLLTPQRACSDQVGVWEVTNIASFWLRQFLAFVFKHNKLSTRYIFRMSSNSHDAEALVHSEDPNHPANHICTLCAKFYTLGWV
jgi:hypothetical protein